MEKWKKVSGFKGKYSVSSIGRVRSNFTLNNHKPRILTPNIKRHGYFTVGFGNKRGDYKPYYVHRLVAKAFLGKSSKEVNHIDINKTNNRVENLEYVSHSRNMVHARDNGSYNNYRGSKHPQAKLNESQVRVIKRLINSHKLKRKEVAKIFNVSFWTIEHIRRGRGWIHVLSQSVNE